MSYNKEIMDYIGITKWHKAGYTGKGIKILSLERVSSKSKFPNVIALNGYGDDDKGHGDKVMSQMIELAPDATFITCSKEATADGSWKHLYLDYILKNNVHLCTSSKLSKPYKTAPNIEKYMQECIDNGTTFCIGAGNYKLQYGKDIYEEAKSDKWLAIGACNFDDGMVGKAFYSCEGEELDYMMITPDQGTSFATNRFTALLARVQQFFFEKIGRTLYRHELIKFINDNVVDLGKEGFDIKTGHGLLRLPDPSTIDVSKYVEDINVPSINEGVYYGGIPQVEDIKIKQMLLTPSEYTRPQTKIKPTAIAWHYVGNPNTSALANRNYFENLKDTHEKKASSHFIIGLEGEILQLIPEDEMSFCTNDANPYTISIECCHPDSTGRFTEATYKSMVWLGKYLMQKHDIKDNIRHYDVTGKACPKWFVDNPSEWEKFKGELEGDEDMPRYKTVEEMPEYYRKDIQELIDKGIIAGRGGEAGLDLSDDMCRMAIYAKKIFEGGSK